MTRSGGSAVRVEAISLRIFGSRSDQKSTSGKSIRVGIALGAAAVLTLTACGGGGEEPDTGGGEGADLDLIEDGKLTSASSGEFQPFSYYEGEDLTGFDKEMSDLMAEELGLEPNMQTGRFDTLVQGVQSNRYDVVIGSMTPTPERENAVDFTDPYYTSGGQGFVQESTECTDPTQMKDVVLGVASGTTYEKELKDAPWVAEVKTFGDDITALNDLDAGRLDVAVTDQLVGAYQIHETGKALKECGDMLTEEQPAFAVKKGNEDLRNALNEALATIKEDGRYAELSEKWFGQDIG